SYHLRPGNPTDPGCWPVRNGVYAGPVTDGKTVAMVWEPPSSASCASAGSSRVRSAAPSTSGRAPSASRIITEGEGGTRFGYGKNCSQTIYEDQEARHTDACSGSRLYGAPSYEARQGAKDRFGQAGEPATAQAGEQDCTGGHQGAYRGRPQDGGADASIPGDSAASVRCHAQDRRVDPRYA